MREGGGERAAAGLVARVAQLDARQRRRRAHGIGAAEGRDLACSAADAVMILNVEPGGWGAETARPESASTEPSRGRTTAIPPSLSPSAADRRALQPGPDRRAHRAPAARLRGGDAARAEAQLRARPAREAVVVGAPRARSRDRPRRARGRRSTGRWARGPGGARRRRARRRAAGARGSSAARARRGAGRGAAGRGASARRRARPLRVTGSATRPRSVPNSFVRTATGHGDLAVDRLARAPDDHLLDRRLGVGHAVVLGEAPGRVLRARVGVELGVHRGGPALRPRGREAHGGVAQLGAVVGALAQHVGDRARGGEQQHEDRRAAAAGAAGAAAGRARPSARRRRGRGARR